MTQSELSADNAPSPPSVAANDLYIAGVGASAGGLEPIETLFSGLSPGAGLAYVLVQHLSPDFESQMDRLIARRTDLTVVHAEDGLEVEPDRIYLAPARGELTIREGRLHLVQRDPDAAAFGHPIDRFLASLAEDQERRSIAVILSGTGSDGSRGATVIHQKGGLVLAQDPSGAKFDGMPRAAIASGAVDVSLDAEHLAQAVTKYAASGDAEAVSLDGEVTTSDTMRLIVRLLKRKYGIDFSQYKPSTVTRRVRRRLELGIHEDLDAYRRRLVNEPGELDALYRDLLIGVTQFFRDSDVFDALDEEVLASLVHAGRQEEVRVWIAGCASGEEAYSIAMLLLDRARQLDEPPPIRVFATDVHRGAIEHANRGRYTEEAVGRVPADLRRRYLVRQAGGAYQVNKVLRRAVVFARQDVLQDAPFTRIDLACCRNLLIYLQPPAQRRVLALLHFALRPNGHLLLGSSETTAALSEEFDPVDDHCRIYRKSRDVRIPLAVQPTPTGAHHAAQERALARLSPPGSSPRSLLPLYDAVLNAQMPPSFLIDDRYRLLHSFGGAERLLTLPSGRATASLLELVPDEMRTSLSGALQQAERRSARVDYTLAEIEDRGPTRLSVEPIASRDGSRAFLVSLARTDRGPSEEDGAADGPGSVNEEYVRALEEELRFTRENLQATVEELEASNEELQATNEELIASNEELQSTNEELQSVNEELNGLNEEHRQRIEELTRLTDDMDNLLRSTEVGVAFLDQDLSIRRFTGAIADLFRLQPRDEGRSFADLAKNLDRPELLSEVQSVLEGGPMVEIEVRNEAGFYLLRVLPYRRESGITGVVLTLFDVTTLRDREADVRRLNEVVGASRDAIVGFDLEGRIHSWNEAAQRLYEEDFGQPGDVHARDLWSAVDSAHVDLGLDAIREGRSTEPRELRRGEDNPRWVSEALFPIFGAEGDVVGGAIIARDISDLKRAEAEIRGGIRQRETFIAVLSHELRNPMMALRSAAAELPAATDDARRRRYSGVVERQVGQMSAILDDLLDVTRLRRDVIELERTKVDLREELPRLLGDLSQRASEHDIALEHDLGDAPLWVDADWSRVRQMVENLVGNAIKFTPAGKRIRVSVSQADGDISFAVADEGVGIPPDEVGRIFDPFVRTAGDAIRQGGRSMGLGLAIVKAIALAHGGDVSAHSAGRGHGTTVAVTLPAAEAPTEDEVPTDKVPVLDADGLRVLLLEDEDDNRELVARHLRRHGFEVTEADDGHSALAAIEDESFDAAVLDLGLPDMSGVDVGRATRRRIPDVYLVALTGYGTQRDRDRIQDAGFDVHVVKPVELARLRRILVRGASPS